MIAGSILWPAAHDQLLLAAGEPEIAFGVPPAEVAGRLNQRLVMAIDPHGRIVLVAVAYLGRTHWGRRAR